MRILTLAVVSALMLSTACKQMDDEAVKASALPEVSVPELSEQTMKDVVKELSLDSYEGRAPGSAGEEKTVAYLIDRSKQQDWSPGNNGSWTQDVPLVEITAKECVRPQHRGQERARPCPSPMAANLWSAAIAKRPRPKIDQSEMVFVGHGIVAPEKGWNDYDGLDVKGKTVVVMVNDPDFDATDLTGEFGGKAMTYYGRWTYKFEEAARQGAAAVADYP